MLPDNCSIREDGKDCVNPPDQVVSIVSTENEYMVGVVCEKHKELFYRKIEYMKKEGQLPEGKIQFTKLKSVGTDCIRTGPEDIIIPEPDKLGSNEQNKI